MDGVLVIEVDLGVWDPPPAGEQDLYQRSFAEFAGQPFFIEWRIVTDAPNSEIDGVGGASLVAWGGPILYHFTIASDKVRLFRDSLLPIVFVDLEPQAWHTHRLELHGDELYVWYIDGKIVDSGLPEGDFPNASGALSWGAMYWESDSRSEWDYIRYGTIPADGSGDFDSDAQVDGEDFYYFDECFLGLDVDAGPGCRFADFDADTDVDCDDWTAFTLAWTAQDDPPDFTPCAVPPPSIPTASNWATALLTLVLLTAGATALSRRRACRSG